MGACVVTHPKRLFSLEVGMAEKWLEKLSRLDLEQVLFQKLFLQRHNGKFGQSLIVVIFPFL
jgi:hypothetical protein